MRIQFLAIGTRGDVQPALALGLGLKKAGFEVRLGAFEEFRPLVEAHGIGLTPFAGNFPGLLSQNTRDKVFKATSFFSLLKLFQKFFADMFVEFLRLSQDCDLLISNAATTMIVEPVAEKLGIPHIETSVFPGLPTRAFPSFFGPWPPNLGSQHNAFTRRVFGTINWFSYQPVSWGISLALRPIIERCRKDILGLPARKPLLNNRSGPPILCGFSQHVLPRPAEWGKHVHVTGYWFLDTPGFEPPSDLQAFLDDGPPPVYIGFGSMPSQHPAQMTQIAIQALAQTGQRGVLFTGHSPLGRGMAALSTSQPVYFTESIPHEWLLPLTAAVVHHGGAGTTAAGIRAGVPSIVVPFGADQRLWAYRVETLGVGPTPIPRSRLTAERLANAIEQAVNGSTIQQRTAALGEKVRAEDGVADAVKIISRYAATGQQSRG